MCFARYRSSPGHRGRADTLPPGRVHPGELASIATDLAASWRPRARELSDPVVLRRDRQVEAIGRLLRPGPFSGWSSRGNAEGAVHVVLGTAVQWWWSDGPDDLTELGPEEIMVAGPGPRRQVLPAGSTALLPMGRPHDLGARSGTGAVVVEVRSPPGEPETPYELDRGLLRPIDQDVADLAA